MLDLSAVPDIGWLVLIVVVAPMMTVVLVALVKNYHVWLHLYRPGKDSHTLGHKVDEPHDDEGTDS